MTQLGPLVRLSPSQARLASSSYDSSSHASATPATQLVCSAWARAPHEGIACFASHICFASSSEADAAAGAKDGAPYISTGAASGATHGAGTGSGTGAGAGGGAGIGAGAATGAGSGAAGADAAPPSRLAKYSAKLSALWMACCLPLGSLGSTKVGAGSRVASPPPKPLPPFMATGNADAGLVHGFHTSGRA